MKSVIFFIISFIGFFSRAEDIGFVGGNIRSAVFLSGELMVFCPSAGRPQDPGTPDSASYYCRDLVLEPSAYDYFRGPSGLQASEVVLTATREDGSIRSKVVDYDGQKYRSADSVNLWISTLFQRPLLKEGRNEITYTLNQNGTSVGRGQFQVLVQKGPSRQCPRSTYTSYNPDDCRSQFSACERYFSQYNNCKIK